MPQTARRSARRRTSSRRKNAFSTSGTSFVKGCASSAGDHRAPNAMRVFLTSIAFAGLAGRSGKVETFRALRSYDRKDGSSQDVQRRVGPKGYTMGFFQQTRSAIDQNSLGGLRNYPYIFASQAEDAAFARRADRQVDRESLQRRGTALISGAKRRVHYQGECRSVVCFCACDPFARIAFGNASYLSMNSNNTSRWNTLQKTQRQRAKP